MVPAQELDLPRVFDWPLFILVAVIITVVVFLVATRTWSAFSELWREEREIRRIERELGRR